MRNLVKSRLWPGALFGQPETKLVCGRPGCGSPSSLLQRMWRRSAGMFLQGEFYCRPRCAEPALTRQLTQLSSTQPPTLPPHRMPLGLLMVARGQLTYPEVAASLEAQRRARYGTIGDWFEKLGFATEQEVVSALGLQWGCPVASSLDSGVLPAFCQIPWPILNALQMLPLQYAATTQTLSLGCGQRIDHGALYEIEKMIGCRTLPCAGGRKTIAWRLDQLHQLPRLNEVGFGPVNDPSEVGRIGLSYINKLGAQDVRLARVAQFIWLRLKSRSSCVDITFEIRISTERKGAPRLLFRSAPSMRAATTSA